MPRAKKTTSSKKFSEPSTDHSVALQQEDRRPVRPPAFIELDNLGELARLTCAFERAPLPIFAIKRMDGKNGYMLSTQLDLFVGSPIFYFAYSDEVKHFLAYKTTAVGEEVSLVDSPSNPALVYAPVIEIVRLPDLFQKTLEQREEYAGARFLPFQVKDVMSIVKVATYKVMFEEPPLPMFAFPSTKGDKWIIGSFTRIEEYEEASIFFYYEQKEKPELNYVGYSTSRALPFFTNRTDEHGNLYVKIIRLKEMHPLVETFD